MRLPKMPEIYIEEVKHSGAASKCGQCQEPTNRSLCPTHLLLAAQRFRKWTAKRHRMGLCILCPKEGDMLPPRGAHRTRRGIRCAYHRGVNNEKCRAWGRKNWKRIYRERIEAGVCANSPKHGPATAGKFCLPCRLRYRENQRRAEARRLRAEAAA